MTFETLLVEQHGTVLLVTLNRPEALNALNAKLLSEMSALIAGVAADAGLRVLVLTGAGDRAFGAGADIAELVSLDAEGARHFAASGQAVFGALERLGKPSIAAINGFALGGGCELAMACTLRLAADTAQFGQPEIDLGIIPGFGGSQRLARLVGRGRALSLLLGGHRIGAVEAERIGLINRVVPAADLKAEALALAQELAGKAPLAMRYLLNAVYAGADLRARAAARSHAVWPVGVDCGHEGRHAGLSRETEAGVQGTLMPILEGTTTAPGLRFAIVVARFNDFVTERLRSGALEALTAAGVASEHVTTLRVPGSFEIPLAAQRAAETGQFDGVVCLGCLIRGATPHFEYISSAVAQLIVPLPMLVTIAARRAPGPDRWRRARTVGATCVILALAGVSACWSVLHLRVLGF